MQISPSPTERLIELNKKIESGAGITEYEHIQFRYLRDALDMAVPVDLNDVNKNRAIALPKSIDTLMLCHTITHGKQTLVNMPNDVIELVQSVRHQENMETIPGSFSLVDYISYVFGSLKLKMFKENKTCSQIFTIDEPVTEAN